MSDEFTSPVFATDTERDLAMELVRLVVETAETVDMTDSDIILIPAVQ